METVILDLIGQLHALTDAIAIDPESAAYFVLDLAARKVSHQNWIGPRTLKKATEVPLINTRTDICSEELKSETKEHA